MRLVRVSEQPIDPTNVPDGHRLVFDLCIEMLDPHGLEPDVRWMTARDAEAVRARLRDIVVPEQVELAGRREWIASQLVTH